MSKVGRNDICPCGSGLKFKKCCQAREDATLGRRREEQSAVRTALDWLMNRYPEETTTALDTVFFGELGEDKEAAFGNLPPQFHGMLDLNSSEWLLTDAELELEDGVIPARNLLFGLGGPLLTAHGRIWLEEIGKRSLSLYEIREVRPGEGIRVSDLLDPEQPELWLRERSGSRSLMQWDILGARLARQDDDWVMTGAVYPFVRDEALACRDEILREIEGVERNSPLVREIMGTIIIDTWLSCLTAKRPIPTMVDASTQKTIRLTTDHYQVTNWELLSTILAEQADVEGDRAHGWVRFTEIGDEKRRSQATLNVKEPSFLDVFCRTLELADVSRKWLERLARTALKFRAREIVDPRSPKALESASRSRGMEIPPEIAAGLINSYMDTFYRNWTEEKVPALGNKTPREAVLTENGRRAVIDLLKSYEHADARRVRDQGGNRFDFGFLWEQLGLGHKTER